MEIKVNRVGPSHPAPKAEPPLEVENHPSLTSDESHLHYLWGQIKIEQRREAVLSKAISDCRLRILNLRAEHAELIAQRAVKRRSIIERPSRGRTPSLASLMKEVGASNLDEFTATLSRLVTALGTAEPKGE